MPIEARNLILFVCLIMQAHWLLWYYLHIEFGSAKVIWEAASGGGVAAIYAVSTKRTQQWLKLQSQGILGSVWLSRFLTLLVSTILILGCVLSRATIKLPSGHDVIVLNAKKHDVENTSGKHFATVYGLSFTKMNVELDGYTNAFTLVPFIPKTLQISENDLFTDSSAYRELNSLLLLSFFQYLENSFLSKANNLFDTHDGKRLVELNKIFQILKLCFVDQDIARNSELQLEGYAQQYRRSAWIPLLRACVLYSQRHYAEAASILIFPPAGISSSMEATYHFFRGVNILKTLSEKIISGQQDQQLSSDALTEFTKTKTILTGQVGFFVDIAEPSAQIFAGITEVYAKNMDSAFEFFSLAARAKHPGLKSRAYNDLGYVELIRGKLGSAETYFLDALQENGTYPLARINLGYVYMAQGRYPAAREILDQASRDEVLKSTSFRDVLLAEAALDHLQIIENKPAPNPAVYDKILKEMNLFNYAGTEPPSLRLAYIHRSLAEQLYTGEKYYGLEIFAATMYAWSYLEATEALAANPAAKDLVDSSLQKFIQLRSVINAGWLSTKNDSGFFSPVYVVLGVINKGN